MTPYNYPHTIDNGAGERLTFLRRVPGRTGDRIEGENLVAPGKGPVMHVHHRQEEGFTVLEGRLGYQRLGEPVSYAGPGESVAFPPGVPHKFWNAGSGTLRCAAYIEPADNLEYFLSGIFAAQRRRGGDRPALFDAAFLARRYRSEFAMVEIPSVVQRVLFPLVVAVGHLLGRYDHFAGAPEPIRT
jgi:mannose-6-phosphate isomerase-like protein (cupin superfamily)